MSTRRRATITVILGAAALLASCKADEARPSPAASSAPEATLPAPSAAEPLPGRASFRTTSHEIAIGNLDARIRGLESALAKGQSPVVREKLCDELLSRASFLGRSEDLARAVELAEGLEGSPDKGASLVLRARARSAVHRFDEAMKDLDEAEKLGAPRIQETRASILEGKGLYEEALAIYQALSAKAPNSVYLALEGGLLGKMSKLEEGQQRFEKAIASFRSASPFSAAWIYYEWGAMYERAGDLGKAKERYALALDRLPQHAHAAAHLAILVPPSEGIALLERVLERSDDPEYRGQLGRLKNLVKAGSGDADIEEAKKGFDRVMAKLPLAYADHAGWFWLDAAKDPKKAAEIARQNLGARKTPEAYVLALVAFAAAGDTKAQCETAAEADKVRFKSPSLIRELKTAGASCAGAPAPKP